MSSYLDSFHETNTYVTLVLGIDDFSEIIKEIIEYVVELVRNKFGLRIVYREIYDEEIQPYMVINDLEPIVFDKIPSVEEIINMFLISAEINTLILPVSNISRDNILTSNF